MLNIAHILENGGLRSVRSVARSLDRVDRFGRFGTSLGSSRNFGKTRFGRFATFDFLTPKKSFRKLFSAIFFFRIVFSVFRNFRQILEELGFFQCQNQIPRWILLQIYHVFRSARRLEPMLWQLTVARSAKSDAQKWREANWLANNSPAPGHGEG